MKIRKKEWILCLTLLLLLFGCFSSAARVSAATVKSAYVKVDGVYYYYNSKGKLVKGFYTTASGKLYYFDSQTGAVKPGIQLINGKRYIISAKGLVRKGWVNYQGNRYYCDKSTGVIKTGWYKTSSKTFYFGKDGAISSGFVKVSGLTYYFSSYGRMMTNYWVKENGNRYYMNDVGRLSKGWKTISGNRYYFSSKGVMQTGWLTYKGKTYYLDANGVRQKGWLLLDGKYYCLSSITGALKKNTFVNGKYVGSNGYWVKNYENVLYSISGTSDVTVSQMVAAYQNSGFTYPKAALKAGGASTITKFCKLIKSEAEMENIKPEVVFAQIMLETGWLQFGGDVSVSQYNFGGLGATGGGVPGNSFRSVKQGIRAVVQHLKGYASTEPLINACVDPRYTYFTHGKAPYVEWLGAQENPYGGGWATASDYGYKIMLLISQMMGFTYEKI